MPSRRMIDPAFWQSETVASLNIEQRYLFIGLFSNADDQGRTRGHPALIRNIIFPYDEVALEQVERDLKALEAIGTIILYQIDGKTYIQVANWWKYQHPQWAYPSEFPGPKGWNDRLRYRAGGDVLTRNWKGELDTLDSGDNPDTPDDDQPPEQPSPNGTGIPLPEETPYIKEELPKALPIDLPEGLPKATEIVLVLGIESVLDSKDDEESRARIREEKTAAIMELYQNNINTFVSPIMAQEMLSDEFIDLPLSWWEEAIKIATGNNVRKWVYVRGILSRSIQLGLSPAAAGPPGSSGQRITQPEATPLGAEVIPEPDKPELTPAEQALVLFKELAAERIPAPQWREHIAPMRVIGCPNGKIQVEVNRFTKELIENRFNKVLEPIALKLNPEGGFEYVVAEPNLDRRNY